MMTFNKTNKILLLLLFTYTLTACIDDDIISNDSSSEQIEGVFQDGYSLNVMVTLDNMGGDTDDTPQALKQWEDYIDPEKFRVLFFNNEHKLLFESKSRWVKQFNNENRWLVSVPVFTYGNDVYDNGEWPWEEIREALTSNDFYVAILANRPEMQWYPGFKNTGLPENSDWIDNTGPHWTPNDYLKKDVFDLHHCQYDPLYHGKSAIAATPKPYDYGFYDFIMEGYDEYDGKGNAFKNRIPQMGALSSWVDWSKTDKHNFGKRYTILPSKENPIPMYGIQKFNKIPNWQEGTPFNLSYDIPGNNFNTDYEKKSIYLLRSVVKLELLIPTTYQPPEVVMMAYPNIYARCEPMDVWTPTDKLWNEQHDNNNEKCEISSILNYGPVSRDGDHIDSDTDKNNPNPSPYQERMGWFYGAWLEAGKWNFNGKQNVITATQNAKNVSYPYPRIFNTCIQRNSLIVCDEYGDVTTSYGDNYYHYVVYLGERNINDPSDLSKLGDTGSGKPTVQYWIFNIGDKMYGLPITNYTVSDNPALDIAPNEKYTGSLIENITDVNGKYMNTITKLEGSNADILPLPLIRNHVYRLTLSERDDSYNYYYWNFAQDISVEKLNSSSSWTISDNNIWTSSSARNLDGLFPNGNYITFGSGIEICAYDESKDIYNSNNIRLKNGNSITLSNLEKGQIITIDCRSEAGSITANNNAIRIQGPSDNKLSSGIRVMNRWEVQAKGSVTFNITVTNSDKDLRVYLIKVTNPNTTMTTRSAGGVSSNGFMIKSQDLYTKKFQD